MKLHKYPRTPHVEGSRRQPGDDDIDAVRFDTLRGRPLVVEEKLDGANSAFSFDEHGRPWLQSRGHFLTGGPREAQFALFKRWVAAFAPPLFERLGTRYTVFGEWTYAKHTIFYDALPHYFHEFDVLDRRTGEFLDTARRRILLADLPVVSVPVLREGRFERLDELTALVGPARYKSPDCKRSLAAACSPRRPPPPSKAGSAPPAEAPAPSAQTDPSDLAEGLYIKVEQDGRVVERVKWVRASFLQAVERSRSHWLDRPLVPNRLRPGVDVFAGQP